MQHGDERARIRCCWAFPSSLAALLASTGCAGEAGVGVPPPAANGGSAPMAADPAPAPEVDAPPAVFRPAPPEVPAPPAPAFVALDGRALGASTGDAILAIYRLWQWSEAAGARELGTLPGLPPESSYLARFSRERAQVVVGDALLPNGGGSVTFRWSDELGMQRVTPAGKSSFPEYANAEGTTLVGHEDNDDGTISDSFRWTARARMALA